MEMIIRHANLEDIPALIDLSRQLGYETQPASLQDRLVTIRSNPHHAIFVAIDARHSVCGWVHIYKVWTLESELYAEIGGLVVDEAHRRQGIGALLMRQAEKWAHAQDIGLIRLRSNTKRVEAHEFYEKIGYARTKSQFTFEKKPE